VRVGRDFGQHGFALLVEEGDGVGEVELLVNVFRAEFGEAGPELFEREAVEAGVDFVDLARLLVSGFFLDDGGHAAVAAAHDASVAGRVGEHGGEDGGCGVAGAVRAQQVSQRLGADQRGVARYDDCDLRAADGAARDQHGVAGAVLRLLENGLCAQRLNHRRDVFGLVADDDVDCPRLQRHRRAHHVLDQRASAGAVQHLGQRRAQACALARGQNDDDEIGKRHVFSAGCKYSPDFFCSGLQVQPAPARAIVSGSPLFDNV